MSGPSAPKPSPQELEAQQAQANLLNQQAQQMQQQFELQRQLLPGLQANLLAGQEQQRLQGLLQPLIYQQMGLTPQYEQVQNYDPATGQYWTTQGRVIGFEKTAQTPEERLFGLQTQLQEQFLQSERAQLEQQAKQQRLQDVLLPHMFREQGYEPQYGAGGEITGFGLTPEGQQRQAIEQAFMQRTQQALAGQLPVNPALMRDLEGEEANIHQALRQQLGSGYLTSTPGIETLGEFAERKATILEGARRGDLTLGEQLGLARGQSNREDLATMLGLAQGNTRPVVSGIPGIMEAGGTRSLANLLSGGYQGNAGMNPFGGGGGNAAAGYGDLVSQYAKQREQEYANRAAQFQRRQQLFSAGGSALGAIVGSFTPVGPAGGAAIGGLAGYGASYI